MTSGQSGDGGQHGGPGDPAQSWNAPPAPPPQYPGYAPAPSAPTGFGAPTPLERPFAVRAGLGAIIANLILGVIGTVLTFTDIDALVAQTVAVTDDPQVTEAVVRTGIVVGAVIGVIIYGLLAMFIWFAWNGRNWARIVLWVLGGISVTFGVIGLATSAAGVSTGQSGFVTALGVCGLLLTAAGIVLLAMKPANEWYRYRGWLRATGQAR